MSPHSFLIRTFQSLISLLRFRNNFPTMKTIAVVLVAVACVAGYSVQDDPWIDRTFNEASIKLFDIERNDLLGAINFSQSIFYTPTRITSALGRLWGLPAGKYFGAVYPANNTCDQQQEPALQIYDESIKGERPLIIFFSEIDNLSDLLFTTEVSHLSLGLEEGNNIINHTVLVYPAAWDQSGPLNSYLQPGGPTAVACGTITSGLLEHHIFQIPQKLIWDNTKQKQTKETPVPLLNHSTKALR